MSLGITANAALPEWALAARVPDSIIQNAYDSFGSQARSLIKTAIALADFHFPHKKAYKIIEEADPNLGIASRGSRRPADWAALVFSESFDAAALACAAAILPVLCDVPLVFAVCMSARPSASILTSLELCGVEDIIHLDEKSCLDLLQEMSLKRPKNSASPGRALVLDADGNMGALAGALSAFLPARHFKEPPRALRPEAGALELSLIKKMLGSRCVLTDAAADADAVYSQNYNSALDGAPPLILDESCAGFWAFPDLSPAFFQISSLEFTLRAPEDGAFA